MAEELVWMGVKGASVVLIVAFVLSVVTSYLRLLDRRIMRRLDLADQRVRRLEAADRVWRYQYFRRGPP